jgi:hypothetical protein
MAAHPVHLSTPTKVGIVLLGLGFLFHVIGFCAPFWHRNAHVEYGHRTTVYYGLWRYCREEKKYSNLPYDFCFSLVDSSFARGECQWVKVNKC